MAKVGSSTATGKRDVPQLGEQAKQSISPLKVYTREELFAMEAGVSLNELLTGDIPKATEFAWKFKEGEDPVKPEKYELLTTQMKNLHRWYLDDAKQGRKILYAQVGKDHFLGQDEIHIEMEELFQLFNLRELDKSIVSCYTL